MNDKTNESSKKLGDFSPNKTSRNSKNRENDEKKVEYNEVFSETSESDMPENAMHLKKQLTAKNNEIIQD